jgi:hypothetical protein
LVRAIRKFAQKGIGRFGQKQTKADKSISLRIAPKMIFSDCQVHITQKKSGRPEGKMEESFKFVTGSEGIGVSCLSR